MIKVKVEDATQVEQLLTSAQYSEQTGE